jgi:hypothetical protein
MPGTTQCIRCGRIISTNLTGYISWRVTDSGHAVCPNCQTPSETVDDDTPLLTDSPDDELLRDLDPDNDEAGDDER